MLLDNGADVNAVDGRNDTAVKISIRGGLYAHTELLKKSGATEN